MKKILISSPRLVSLGLIILILTLIFPVNNAWAKFPDDLPGPNVMPDSPFYIFKIWYERVILFFTFGAVKKAEKYKTFAEKRAYEIKEMIKKGKEELATKPKEIYKSYLNKAKEKLEGAVEKATKQRREELKQELEKKIEEIKNKINEMINLW